jgi:hypothetical protein
VPAGSSVSSAIVGAMRLVAAVAVAALVLPATVSAASVTYKDTIEAGTSGRVSVTARSSASFEVMLRVPAAGRTQLFLAGARAPKGGPLIDTATTACPRSGAVRICRGRYEPLPAGTYTWRVRRTSGAPAAVVLTVRW